MCCVRELKNCDGDNKTRRFDAKIQVKWMVFWCECCEIWAWRTLVHFHLKWQVFLGYAEMRKIIPVRNQQMEQWQIAVKWQTYVWFSCCSNRISIWKDHVHATMIRWKERIKIQTKIELSINIWWFQFGGQKKREFLWIC